MSVGDKIGRDREEDGMQRLGLRLLVMVVALNLWVAAAWATGPSGTSTLQIDGRIRDIFPAQWLLIMDDGTALRVQDPRQLDGLREGMKLRVRYEDSFGRRMILRIEPITGGP
jgi:hypothetical protein